VWRLATDRLEQEDQYEPVKAETARWSPTGRQLAVTNSSTEDVLVLGPDGKSAATLKTGLYAAQELYWSPNGEHLAATTTTGGGVAWLWDVRTGDLRHSTTLSGTTGIVIHTTLAWSPDNTNAVVAADGRLLVLSVDGTQKALRGPDRTTRSPAGPPTASRPSRHHRTAPTSRSPGQHPPIPGGPPRWNSRHGASPPASASPAHRSERPAADEPLRWWTSATRAEVEHIRAVLGLHKRQDSSTGCPHCTV
jgi:hypothetical protein